MGDTCSIYSTYITIFSGAMAGLGIAMILVGLTIGVGIVFAIGFLTGKKMPIIPKRGGQFGHSQME